jgi:hypothetical protein
VFLKGAAQEFTVAGNTLFLIDASVGNPLGSIGADGPTFKL